MGAYSVAKDKYDDIAADYLKSKGYTIISKGGKGGAYPDIIAERGGVTAIGEVKSPAEKSQSDFAYKVFPNKYLGGIVRKDLLKMLNPIVKPYRGIVSLIKLYIATVTHQIFSVASESKQNGKSLEIYLFTPLDEKYKNATTVALGILESIGLIKTDPPDQHCVGKDCLGVYKIFFNDSPKAETEKRIEELAQKAKDHSLPINIPVPSSIPSVNGSPFAALLPIIKPTAIAVLVILILVLAWWLLSHYVWTSPGVHTASVPQIEKAEIIPPVANEVIAPAKVIEQAIPQKRQIMFQFGQAKIKDNALNTLVPLVDELKAVTIQYKVNIEGYTCNIGGEIFNYELSKKRAEAVKLYLVSNGILQDSINTIPKGIAALNNDTIEGRVNNRRVEITISKSEGE
jgi:outer membrane protein OmpA-like peptidoglycan-associated protein